MTTNTKQIGASIKSIRIQRGITQATVAEKSGITQQYIGLIESGQRSAALDVLIRIATALGCVLDVTLTRVKSSGRASA